MSDARTLLRSTEAQWQILVSSSGGFRGGALGASAPPAESMVKILTYLFSAQCSVGTFLRVLKA